MLDLLRAWVLDSDLPHRQIEGQAGFSPGYLSQVLAGKIELKLVHIFALLEALDRSPAMLFQSLYGEDADQEVIALPDDRDVASVYGIGIESLERLRARLERCEDVLTELPDTVAREE